MDQRGQRVGVIDIGADIGVEDHGNALLRLTGGGAGRGEREAKHQAGPKRRAHHTPPSMSAASIGVRSNRVARRASAATLGVMNFQDIDSPVGHLRLIADGDRLVGVCFENGRDARRGTASLDNESSPVLERTRAQLAEYFAGRRQDFDLPLDPRGSEFQRRVWQRLTRIPYGETTSYGAVARELGDPRASRAVGLANGSNPIPIVIPCHRVIGADGSLTGFGGGLPVKAALLELERGAKATPAALAGINLLDQSLAQGEGSDQSCAEQKPQRVGESAAIECSEGHGFAESRASRESR